MILCNWCDIAGAGGNNIRPNNCHVDQEEAPPVLLAGADGGKAMN
jgi:hypothetical protein